MTQMLSSSFMKRLTRFSLTTKQSIISGHKGEHRSRKHGTSLEFSDFRQYHLGDDLRQIDWNTYARTNKYYIKRFTDEKELFVTLFLDTTRSMFIVEKKWEQVKKLAASLAFLTLNHNDRFRILTGEEQYSKVRSFYKGKSLINRVNHEISDIEVDDKASYFADTLHKVVKTSNMYQGISVVVSDFLEPVEPLFETLKQLQTRKQQVLLVQVLLSEEQAPNLTGDLKLVDVEISTSKDVSMSRTVLELYDKKFSEHEQAIKTFARNRGMAFISCLANEAIEEVIIHKLAGTGFLK